jgi:alkyl sulfatase BDS1-like metallo-beta-lactamase superfamily hydrolase
VSAGAVGLIAPNRLVEKEIEEIEVDGIKMVFQDTPNTEAPTEMNTYIPAMKALWMAENVIASLHNIFSAGRNGELQQPRRDRAMSTELFLNFLGFAWIAAKPRVCGSRSTSSRRTTARSS